MVNQIYPTELQLNKANYFDTEVPFLDFVLAITNNNSYCEYILQLIRFAGVCANASDFNNRKQSLTS